MRATICLLLVTLAAHTNAQPPPIGGVWVRSESTYDPNDTMEIGVDGGQATIRHAPEGATAAHREGAVVWRDIQPTVGCAYSLRVLGSNGAYYPALLGLDGDQLELVVQHDGVGSSQTWRRTGGPSTGGAGADPVAGVLAIERFEVDVANERGGDEPYLMVFTFAGRPGDRDALTVTFRSDVGPETLRDQSRIGGGATSRARGRDDWAREGDVFELLDRPFRFTFPDVRPYGFFGVLVVAVENDGAPLWQRHWVPRIRDDLRRRLGRVTGLRLDVDDPQDPEATARALLRALGDVLGGAQRNSDDVFFAGGPSPTTLSDDLIGSGVYYSVHVPASTGAMRQIVQHDPRSDSHPDVALIPPGQTHDGAFSESRTALQALADVIGGGRSGRYGITLRAGVE